MPLNRRSFLRNLGALASVLGIVMTVTLPQQRKRFIIYSDTRFDSSIATMTGFKGAQFLETGYVYAPYIPLVTTTQVYTSIKRLTSRRNLLQLS